MQVAQQQPELAAELAAIQAGWLDRKEKAKSLLAGLDERRALAKKAVKDLQADLIFCAVQTAIGDPDYPSSRIEEVESRIEAARREVALCDLLEAGLPGFIRCDFLQDGRRRKVEQRIREEAAADAGNSGETRAILPEKQEGNRRKSPAKDRQPG